jgi:hypothetical protein
MHTEIIVHYQRKLVRFSLLHRDAWPQTIHILNERGYYMHDAAMLYMRQTAGHRGGGGTAELKTAVVHSALGIIFRVKCLARTKKNPHSEQTISCLADTLDRWK